MVALVSIPMAVVLLVAIFTVHLQYGFSSIKLQMITSSGARLASLITKPTYFIWPVLSPWSLGEAALSPSTTGLFGERISLAWIRHKNK